jgi:cardiolipin synthase
LNLKISAVAAFLVIFSLSLTVFASELTGEFHPASVKDISDRAYEPVLIELLDKAEKSIVISMYNISLGANERNPISFLLGDLLEARQRNVEVVMYLNTNFREIDKEPHQIVSTPFFKKLLDAGCVIHLLPSRRRLHDKLIIVDSRYVVDGSTNWSISALKSSFESATLIDSPELAEIKLSRLKSIPLTDEPKKKEEHRRIYLENLPAYIALPKEVLLNSGYFSKMLTNSDERSMDLYFLLLSHSQVVG